MTVERVSWAFRQYATRLTPVGEYRRWWLEIAVGSPTEPLLVVVMEMSKSELRYERLTRRAEARESFTFKGQPFEMAPEVTGGLDSQTLKYQMPTLDTVMVQEGEVLETGSIWPVVRSPDGVDVDLALIAQSDTESARGRWRLRPSRADGVPAAYSFLLSGRRSGHLPWPGAKGS